MKGSIHQENIMIVNIYEPNIAAPKCKKQKQTQLKGKIKSNMNLIPDSQQWIDYPDSESIRNQQI